jgi:hypothetical protein
MSSSAFRLRARFGGGGVGGGLWLVVAASVALGAHPPRAWASDPAKAERLIEEANQMRRQGQAQKAIGLLQQAYDAAPSARTAGQLGLGELDSGYWLEAEQHLGEAVASKGHPWVEQHRPVLEDCLRKARSHIVEVALTGGPDGAEVTVNAKPAGTLPLPAPIKALEGRLAIEVRARGYAPFTRTLNPAGGSKQDVAVSLVRATPTGADRSPPRRPVQPPLARATEPAARNAEPPIVARREDSGATPDRAGGLSTFRRAAPWTLLAAGALAAGVGVWQHVEWRAAQHNYEAIPNCYENVPMRGFDSRCQGLYDTLAGDRLGAYIAYGVGGALGAAGIVLLFVNAAHSGGGEASVALAPGPGDAGLSLLRAF